MTTRATQWLTVNEVLKEVRCSLSTIAVWCSDGKGPKLYRRMSGKQIRVKRADLEAWLESMVRA